MKTFIEKRFNKKVDGNALIINYYINIKFKKPNFTHHSRENNQLNIYWIYLRATNHVLTQNNKIFQMRDVFLCFVFKNSTYKGYLYNNINNQRVIQN